VVVRQATGVHDEQNLELIIGEPAV